MIFLLIVSIVTNGTGRTTRRAAWAVALVLAVGAAILWGVMLIRLFQRELDAEELRSWAYICVATAVIPVLIALAVDRLADDKQ